MHITGYWLSKLALSHLEMQSSWRCNMIQIMLGIGVNNEDDTATVKVGSVLYFTQRRIESLLLQLNKPLTHTIIAKCAAPSSL
jgi:hypothetical protein